MPQDKLEQELLRRPPDSRNPYSGSGLMSRPWKDEDMVTRFMGGLTGADEPGGDVAGLLGSIVSMGSLKSGLKVKPPKPPVHDQLERVTGDLPQWYTSIQESGKYTPQVSNEMGRLIGEMIQDKPIKAAWQQFHKINPEATGHVRRLTLGSDPVTPPQGSALKKFLVGELGGHRGAKAHTAGEAQWAGDVFVNPNIVDHVLKPSSKAYTTAHELQHHAQQMLEGKQQFRDNYWTLDKLFGYGKNPYEAEANQVADGVIETIKLNKLSGR